MSFVAQFGLEFEGVGAVEVDVVVVEVLAPADVALVGDAQIAATLRSAVKCASTVQLV